NFFLRIHLPIEVTRQWQPDEMVGFVQFLLRSCLSSSFDDDTEDVYRNSKAGAFWMRFPPTIRCAMVINLLRKLNDAVVVSERGREHVHRTPFEHRVRFTIGKVPALTAPHQELPRYACILGAPAL